MPKLPTPQSTPKLPQNIFTPESQGAAAARAQGELGGAISQAGQRVGAAITQRKTQGEISKLNSEFATAQAELTNQWRETLRTADPNDDTTAERFRNDVVKPRLEAMRELANTGESKAYFDRAASGLGAGFLVSTEAGQQGLRETAAVQNWDTFKNQMGDSLIADPLSFDTSVAMIDIQVDGLVASAGLSTEKGLVLKAEALTEAAVASATGLINQDPEAGRAEIEAGAFSEFIDASQKQRLLNYADSQERAQEAARVAARKEASAFRQTDYMKEAINQDGTINTAAIPELQGRLLRDPLLAGDPAAARAMNNFLEQLVDDESGSAAQTDPAAFDDFMSRSALPPGHPDRPTRNEILFSVGRTLSKEDAGFLMNTVIDEKGSDRDRIATSFRNESLRNSRVFLTGSGDLSFVSDPEKILNYDKFVKFATVREVQLKEEGKTPDEIWAPDGPIMGQLQNFNRKLSLDEQTQLFRETFNEQEELVRPEIEGDPLAFDTGRRNQIPPAPALRDGTAGPKLGETFNGKPLGELNSSEMDAWLKENP